MQGTATLLALILALGPAAPTVAAEDATPAEDAPSEDLPDLEGEEALPDVSPDQDVEGEAAAGETDTEEAPEAETEPAAPPPQLDTPDEPPLVPARRDRLGCDGNRSCRSMTVAGIVVGTLGLVGVGVGIGLLVKPDEVVADQPIYVSSTHPPGLVSLTICSGLTLTSVLMLVAAHKGYKRRDLQARVRVEGFGLRF